MARLLIPNRTTGWLRQPPKRIMACIRQSPMVSRRLRRGFGSSITTKYRSPSLIDAFVVDQGNRMFLSGMVLDACWLWSNDAKWIHASSGQRLKTPADYPGSKIRNVRVVNRNDKQIPPPSNSCHSTGGVYNSKEIDDNLVIEIEWDDSCERSFYFVSWLMNWAKPKAISEVSKANALGRHHTLSLFNYEDVIQSDITRLNLYSEIFCQGAALIQNCPRMFECDSSSPSAVIGRLLAGSLSHGALYGDIFHVQSLAQAHNVAYTSIRLPPHQDLVYYESPPGLQLLHCVQQRGTTGGVSFLVDGLAAAHTLRDLVPDLFEILTTIQATFCKQREGADIVAFRPHIQVSHESQEILGINWSPPFEGPLRNTARSQDYYKAYTAFACLVDKDLDIKCNLLPSPLVKTLKEYAMEHTFEILLSEGEMLVFNNRRMLHGRTSFEMIADDGARHLVGAYTNIDETLNHFHLLMRKHGWRNEFLNVGNGTDV